MGYTWAETFNKAVTLFARELHMSRKDIKKILGDGKETVFKVIENRNNREMIFIPDKCGFICAVEG